MDIYERYGRVQEAYEKECESHRSTINLLQRLKSGEVTLDSLVITDSTWNIVHIQMEEPEAIAPVN